MASSTMTTTTTHSTVSQVLVDYNLHHSDSNAAAPKEEEQQNATTTTNNPPGWDTQHRRVPAHRPINRELDQSQRSVYQNAGERVFVTVMFSGLLINASAAKLWHMTLGRVNDGIFRYPLGGEI